MGLLILLALLIYFGLLGPLLYLILIVVLLSLLAGTFGHISYGYNHYYGNGYDGGFGYAVPTHFDGGTTLLVIVIILLLLRRPRRW